MRRQGDTITFDHVTRKVDPQKLRLGEHVLIVCWFDGEPDLWAATGSPRLAVRELTQYYKSDWDGTCRQVPVIVCEGVVYDCINCI